MELKFARCHTNALLIIWIISLYALATNGLTLVTDATLENSSISSTIVDLLDTAVPDNIKNNDMLHFPATGSRPREIVPEPSLRKMADLSARFAWNAYKTINTPGPSNIFFSPYSLMNALGMLVLGTDGTTKDQLLLLLGLNPLLNGAADLHKGLQLENEQLRAENTSIFAVANKFFVEASTTANINRDYLRSLEEYYTSSMQAVNFTSNPAEAVEIVNDWVLENTFGKIKDFLPSFLDPQTQLILANAIYFEGKWKMPFNSELTKNDEFQTSPQQKVDVPFMYLSTQLYYAHDDFLSIENLIIPYTDFKYAMHIILPDSTTTLEAIESQMSYLHLDKFDRSTRLTPVVLKMPKFSLKKRLGLRDMLYRMNATDVFNPLKNNFPEIFLNSRPGFFVNEVFHEAVVEVDERGTVAAAATGIIGTRVADPSTKFVVLDRPFLFYISDESNGFVLFWGRVDNPNML